MSAFRSLADRLLIACLAVGRRLASALFILTVCVSAPFLPLLVTIADLFSNDD